MEIRVSNNGATVNVSGVRMWVEGNVAMIHIDSDPVGTTKFQQQVGSTLEIRIVPLEEALLVVDEAQCTKVFVDFGARLVQRAGIAYQDDIKDQYVFQFQLGEPTAKWTTETGTIFA